MSENELMVDVEKKTKCSSEVAIHADEKDKIRS